MKYFKQLKNLPTYNLAQPLDAMLANKTLFWDSNNQISLTSTPNAVDDFHTACGSLTHDWANKEWVFDDQGNKTEVVHRFEIPRKETDFTDLCTVFVGTEFENLYKGQVSKSGIAILPSKRTRKIPEIKKPSLADEALSELKAEQPVVKEESLDTEEVVETEKPLELKEEVNKSE